MQVGNNGNDEIGTVLYWENKKNPLTLTLLRFMCSLVIREKLEKFSVYIGKKTIRI